MLLMPAALYALLLMPATLFSPLRYCHAVSSLMLLPLPLMLMPCHIIIYDAIIAIDADCHA